MAKGVSKPERVARRRQLEDAVNFNRDAAKQGYTTTRAIKGQLKTLGSKGVSVDEAFRVRAKERMRAIENRAGTRNANRDRAAAAKRKIREQRSGTGKLLNRRKQENL
jgi:hypothetical protein